MTTSQPAAEFVARTRKRLNLTQPEFADLLGMKRHAIMRYENGGPVPRYVIMAIKYLLVKRERAAARRRAAAKEGGCDHASV